MSKNQFAHCCHHCGAKSFRRVIARDEGGVMRATPRCICSGCKLVFVDSRDWRGGSLSVAEVEPAAIIAMPPVAEFSLEPS